MPSDRPSSPRRPRARGAASRPSGSRAGGRPAARPGSRGGSGRSRTSSAAGVARPRVTGRAVVLVLVLAVLAISYASSMRAYLEQRDHLAALRADIAESQANIEELKREKRRWQDPAYQEAQAAARLGMVKPGEIVFQVIDENGEPLGHADSLTEPGDVAVVNEPAWWETAWQTMEAAGNPRTVPVPVDQIDAPRKAKR